ncbi:MAG: LysM peptidoglycan-binding domain-containing protein, partial [Lachnospiraceae bacterium]|nr:LysM peptidoglycan-binding domain-containing protein [Lachnospiraceae bacterium]
DGEGGNLQTPTVPAPTVMAEPPTVTQAPNPAGDKDTSAREPGEKDGDDSEKTDGMETDKNGEEGKNGEDGTDGEKQPEDGPDGNGSVQTAEIGGPGPSVDTSDMEFYIVKPGDTLVGICRRLYGNLDNLEYIKGLNQLNNENLIYIDQELLVPQRKK